MNKTSREKVDWAVSVARVYGGHPGVQAIILGGSTARGVATEHSDIDLGIFWTEIPPEQERGILIRQVGGTLSRLVDNHLRYSSGNPRRQGCIEIIELRPTSTMPPLVVDLEHETVAGTEQLLREVLEEHDPSLEKQELLSVIQYGIQLYGTELVGRWRKKSETYPDEIAYKMVSRNHSGIGRHLMAQFGRLEAQDWLSLYQGFLSIGQSLLLILMGLNRIWAFTDNTNFKGLKPFVEGLDLKPRDFVNRLGLALQTETACGIRDFAGLVADVLDLVEAQMPTVVTQGERELLRQVFGRTVGCGMSGN
jgi:predicted nucleotidyltransferase